MAKSVTYFGIVSTFLTSAVLLSACTSQFQAEIKESVNQAVVDNKNAKSMLEWETSKNNPEHYFAELRQKDSPEVRLELCKSLDELKPGDLAQIYEAQIKEEKNSSLLSDCKENLLKKIELYWKAEKKTLEGSGTEAQTERQHVGLTDGSGPEEMKVPKFTTEIQYVDTTNGYYAYTGDVKNKQVILTFDDGPSPEYTSVILATLRQAGVKAIFFNCGNRVDAHPELTRAIAKDGHSIGSHTYAHNYLGPLEKCPSCRSQWLNTEKSIQTIRQAHQSIVDAIGWVDPFFRFPYGAHSPELREYLKENSVGEFFWTVDSEDWKAGRSNLETIKFTMDQLDNSGKGIILFHDVQRKTAEILPQILRELAKRGYQPVVLQSTDADARLNSKLANRRQP